MFDDLVLHEGPIFENASLAALFCRDALERSGYVMEAGSLRGIRTIHNPVAADAALSVLRTFKGLRGDAREYVAICIRLCEEALASRALRVAS
jgi:hypothetical protein